MRGFVETPGRHVGLELPLMDFKECLNSSESWESSVMMDERLLGCLPRERPSEWVTIPVRAQATFLKFQLDFSRLERNWPLSHESKHGSSEAIWTGNKLNHKKNLFKEIFSPWSWKQYVLSFGARNWRFMTKSQFFLWFFCVFLRGCIELMKRSPLRTLWHSVFMQHVIHFLELLWGNSWLNCKNYFM